MALVWVNSPWSSTYHDLWSTVLAIRLGTHDLSLDLRGWVNDGLMAFFFFVVGLEIRRELDMGELRERRRVATPVLAAIGGMLAPALIYLAFNAGQSTARGWAIPMATDTAFALGLLALVGARRAASVRPFLLTLVIFDDVVALAIVALAFTKDISVAALAVSFALFLVVLIMRWAGVRNGVAYFVVGFALWVAVIASGVHADARRGSAGSARHGTPAIASGPRTGRCALAPLPRGTDPRVRTLGESGASPSRSHRTSDSSISSPHGRAT